MLDTSALVGYVTAIMPEAVIRQDQADALEDLAPRAMKGERRLSQRVVWALDEYIGQKTEDARVSGLQMLANPMEPAKEDG